MMEIKKKKLQRKMEKMDYTRQEEHASSLK